ncbi:hypothetical protein ACJJTC_014515 [Scirpophaga incertulas]
MDTESEIDNEGPSTPKKAVKRKHYAQKYRKEWESDNIFKDWIGRFLVMLIKRRHIKASKVKPSIKNIAAYFSKPSTSNETAGRTAELKLCAFVAEHNTSFMSIDHLTDLLKECFPDSNICSKIKLKRTKYAGTIKTVIGECHKMDLATKLKTEKFGILIDESTDWQHKNYVYFSKIL